MTILLAIIIENEDWLRIMKLLLLLVMKANDIEDMNSIINNDSIEN